MIAALAVAIVAVAADPVCPMDSRGRLWTPFVLPELTGVDAQRRVYRVELELTWQDGQALFSVDCPRSSLGLLCPSGQSLRLTSGGRVYPLKKLAEHKFALQPKEVSVADDVRFVFDDITVAFIEDGAQKLARIWPCLVQWTPVRSYKPLDAQFASQRAAELANDACDDRFQTRPFNAVDWPIEKSGGRWRWGRMDVAGPNGYSARVAFDLDGGNPKVELFYSSDENEL